MSRLPWRFASFIGCAVVAASLGGAAGYRYGQSGATGGAPAIDLFAAAQSRYTSYRFALRDAGDNPAGEDELRAYYDYLGVRARDPDTRNPNVYSFDRAIVLVRLSEFVRKRRDADEAARLMKDADATCPSTGLRDCSANDLLRIVRDRDRQAWAATANSGP